MKKLLALAATATLLCVGTALAGNVSVDFSFSGNGSTSSGGSWSWAGGSSTLSSSFDTAANLNGNTIGYEIVDVTSGPGTGGSGTMGDPFTFGASAANSIQIGGCVDINGTTTCGTLFTGQFASAQAAENGSGPTVDFTATDVTGTLSADLATSLGLSSDNVTGSFAATLFGMIDSTGGSGLTGSGDLALVGTGNGPPPTPEPSSLLLLGSGLIGLAKLVKSRRS